MSKRFTPEQERILNEWARTASELRRAFPYTTASNTQTQGLGFHLNKDLDLGKFYITVRQSDGLQRLDATQILTFNADSFYLERTSDPFEILVNFRGSAGGGSSVADATTASNLGAGEGVFAQEVGDDLQFKSLIAGTNISLSSSSTEITINSTAQSGSGFYGIIVKDSNQPNYKTDTVTFSDDFYLSSDSVGKPVVNLDFTPDPNFSFRRIAPSKEITIPTDQQMAVFGQIVIEGQLNVDGQLVVVEDVSATSSGFYGIVIKESDGNPPAFKVDTIIFDSASFYLHSDSTGKPTVSFRPGAASTDLTTASNLGAGEGVFAQEVGDDLQFKSLVAGTNITLTPSATTITIAASASGATDPGFYGIYIRESDGNPPTFRNDTIIFDSESFYLHANSVGKPTVSFRGSSTDHGNLTGLGDDDHPQYLLRTETPPGFYGIIVKESDDSIALRDDTIVFTSSDFNVVDVSGKPTITIVDSGIDHGGLSGLGDDDHPQYLLRTETPPGFYGITIKESDESFVEKDDTIIFSSSDFNITSVGGKPIVTVVDSGIDHGGLTGLGDDDHPQYLLRTETPPGFYGIIVKESDNSIALRDDTIVFTSSDFNVADISGKPTVTIVDSGIDHGALTGLGDDDHPQYLLRTETPPGFYGVLVKESDGSYASKDDTIVFTSSDFNVVDGADGKPTVTIVDGGIDHGGLSGLGDDDHPQYLLKTETPPGFYGIVIRESDLSFTTRDDTIEFDSSDFNVADVSSKPRVTIVDAGIDHGGLGGLADDDHPQYLLRTETPPGFYGIYVRESDGNPPTFRNDTLIFDSEAFYLHANSVGKPVVSFRPGAAGVVTDHGNLTGLSDDDHPQYLLRTEIPPGFYGIVTKHSNNTTSFSGIKVVSFESQFFYLSQNSPNTDEVQVQLRNLPGASGGEANTASNLGAGEGVFASKVGVDLQFKSLVEGSNITLTSDANIITIDAAAGGGGFYGIYVRESDGNPPTFRNDTLIFDSSDFYLHSNSVGKPTVSFRPPVDKYRCIIEGGVPNVSGNSTIIASYGNNVSVGDPTMAFSGSVVALSLTMTAARTGGTCTMQVKKNGVAQVGAGQTIQLNATTTNFAFAKLSTPITYVAGDRIGFQTVTVSFSPTTGDATLLAWCEESF